MRRGSPAPTPAVGTATEPRAESTRLARLCLHGEARAGSGSESRLQARYSRRPRGRHGRSSGRSPALRASTRPRLGARLWPAPAPRPPPRARHARRAPGRAGAAPPFGGGRGAGGGGGPALRRGPCQWRPGLSYPACRPRVVSGGIQKPTSLLLAGARGLCRVDSALAGAPPASPLSLPAAAHTQPLPATTLPWSLPPACPPSTTYSNMFYVLEDCPGPFLTTPSGPAPHAWRICARPTSTPQHLPPGFSRPVTKSASGGQRWWWPPGSRSP